MKALGIREFDGKHYEKRKEARKRRKRDTLDSPGSEDMGATEESNLEGKRTRNSRVMYVKAGGVTIPTLADSLDLNVASGSGLSASNSDEDDSDGEFTKLVLNYSVKQVTIEGMGIFTTESGKEATTKSSGMKAEPVDETEAMEESDDEGNFTSSTSSKKRSIQASFVKVAHKKARTSIENNQGLVEGSTSALNSVAPWEQFSELVASGREEWPSQGSIKLLLAKDWIKKKVPRTSSRLASKQTIQKPSKEKKHAEKRQNKRASNKMIHQDWCHLCKVGGELVCCTWCPFSYHVRCVGLEHIPKGYFSCPQHHCAVCGRNATAVGGMLFRCAVCPCAYCEDHLPTAEHDGREDLDACEEMEAQNYPQPASAFYITCSHSCTGYYREFRAGIFSYLMI